MSGGQAGVLTHSLGNLTFPCPQGSLWGWSQPRAHCPPRLQRKPSSQAGQMCKALRAPWRKRRRRDSVKHWSSWGWPQSWASESELRRLPVPSSASSPVHAACPCLPRVCSTSGSLRGDWPSRSVSCDTWEGLSVISRRICISGGTRQGGGKKGRRRAQPCAHTGHLAAPQARYTLTPGRG